MQQNLGANLETRISALKATIADYDSMLSRLESNNKENTEGYQQIMDLKFHSVVKLREIENKFNRHTNQR